MTLQEILHEIVSALSNPRDHLHKEIDDMSEPESPAVELEPEPEAAPEPEPEAEPAEEVTPDAPAE